MSEPQRHRQARSTRSSTHSKAEPHNQRQPYEVRSRVAQPASGNSVFARLMNRSFNNPLWCYHGFNAVVIVLTIFGLIMVFSSSSVSMIAAGASPFKQALMQSAYAILGLIAAVIAAHIPYAKIEQCGFAALVFAIFMQMLTFTPLGVEIYGNRGWIMVGPVTIQPAEIVKLALCIWLPKAMRMAYRHNLTIKDSKERLRTFIRPGITYGCALGIVLLGKDLGTGLIIVAIGIVGFLTGGFPMKIMAIAGTVLAGLIALFVLSSPNRMNRITAAYRPCTDMQGVCYQSIHSKYAIASGGLLGVGIGNSREKWNYLPEAHNDFIYAIIGEETGFVGAVLVLALFVILGWCMIVMANKATNEYVAVSLLCFTTWLVGQALVNIAVVLGLLPVMGVPMPFVSAGGSSLIMCLVAAGVCDSLMRSQPEVRAEKAL